MYFIRNVLSFYNFVNFIYDFAQVGQCCLFNYCTYLAKPSEHFNRKPTFAVQKKSALKDKIFHNLVQIIRSEKAKFDTLNHTVQSTGTAHEIRHYTEKIRAKSIWLLNCCFPGQAQCFLSSTCMTWISEKTPNKKSSTYPLTHEK